MTLEEWVDFWFQPDPIRGDGVPAYFRRGRNRDSYVMARHNDEGAYELGNISIKTQVENCRERKPSPNRFSATAKRRVLIQCAWTPRPVRTPLGSFKSVTAAAKAHDRTCDEIRRQILKGTPGFQYVEAWEALVGVEHSQSAGSDQAGASVVAQTLQGGL
ncbi:hypothetical protein FF100_22135 [Methylobacterium terricola]|uniref:Uncharacterized protein n=1 Tax=Methylobacterium terricola TaxID=2583531 RepID=A0A5C4LC92_9HYPH|nr:hypothetical protein [Methylobacterium terricola]TNC10853.1 hypothetical protein FF100_22135 [Methylobacterium terricola]